ncbi:Uncharacterised protein [uncultured archaeon]|nr:Uncharacterised protein [uncultured archaeon]
MQHPEEDGAFSDEEIARKGDTHGQAKYPKASLEEMDAKTILFSEDKGPGMAQYQRYAHQEQKKRG